LGSAYYRFTGSQRVRERAEDKEQTSEDHPDPEPLVW
jgi:hypothetical protein